MNEQLLDRCGNLLAECFWEELGVKAQCRGISDGLTIFQKQCRGQTRAFFHLGGLTIFGDADGLAMGYFSAEETRLAEFLQEELGQLLATFPAQDLQAMQENSQAVLEIARPDWYRAHLAPAQEVYVLQAVAVRKERRGTGVFRKLLTPLLEEAAGRNCPVVLQTFEQENAEKYQHMGFQLLEKIPSQTIPLTAYNLMWRRADCVEG